MSAYDAGAATTPLAHDVSEILATVDAVVASGAAEAVAPETVRDLTTAAVRLFYARAADLRGFAPGPDAVSPSEALTLVAALLAEHDVSTFDLALWLSRTSQR